ncbi:hypothetical protein ND748_00935 [Frankia sp. AiPs1]|uniref:hypothetical protein n=1 Tax=Frankia sp. AiPs1 TaxID=573493 RepID=UPI0020433748|nr:hypothetical protein [Frankia sp. AiPs1]MCM3920254.1 hypothetical protein [Frankia sp. AiPs1]
MGKPTPMDREAADRIRRAAWDNPDSATVGSGWDVRAQDAADKNEDEKDDE